MKNEKKHRCKDAEYTLENRWWYEDKEMDKLWCFEINDSFIDVIYCPWCGIKLE